MPPSILPTNELEVFLLSSEGIVEKELIEGERYLKILNYLSIPEKRVEEVMRQILST